MKNSYNFCWVVLLMAMAINASAQGVNFSELRKVIHSETAPISDRLNALEAFSTELNSTNRVEYLEMADLLQPLAVTDADFSKAIILKAKGLNYNKDVELALKARALIDSTLNLSGVRSFDDYALFHLIFQRGRAQWRIRTQEKRWTKALADFQTALDIAEELGDIELQTSAHDALGHVHMSLKDNGTAVEHYSFIMRFSEDEEKRAQALFNLAFSYDDSPLTQDTALAYMMQAQEILARAGNQTKVGQAAVGIAKIHFNRKDYDAAVKEYERALTLVNNYKEQVTCYEYLGQIAQIRGRSEEAVLLFDSALRLNRESGGSRMVYISTKLGKAYVSLGEEEQGLALCQAMLDTVLSSNKYRGIGRATRLADCYDCVQTAEFALGLYRESADSRDRRDSAKEVYNLLLEERDAAFSTELFQYEGLKQEEKRLAMDKQKDDQRTLLVVIVLLLIAFAIFITSRYRFTRKQSELISTQRQQLQDRQRELIRANAELEIALNHKAVFLSNMSHEIRTPLNAIVGMSNLATKENMAEGARKYLRNIVTASSNLIDIVNDILDFSKLEAGKLEIAQEPFCVQDALEVAENVMRIPAEQKGLQFNVDADPGLPAFLMGDASRLNQVLINLVGNAIKFTLEGGVTMRAEVSPLPSLPAWCPAPEKSFENWFVVRVTDTGIGIPEDKLEKIFESFNQGDSLKTRKFGGTGLGLSISKQIVELQGGVIWVESVEGEGSTFAFALPALISEMKAEQEAEKVDDVEIGPLRILIAEDNPFNVIVTEDTLNSELKDLTIGKAENGRIAFEMVRDEDWDVVLMDVHMPEMSGLEATSAIRKLPNERSSTIIIAMTASVLREETDSYIRHGMNGFVPKPFQVDQLISEIRRLRKERIKLQKPVRTLPPLRILIAEDNPFNVIVAEDTLLSELSDVTIGKAENGKKAFEEVRDGEWDIVLMDIAMPEMTGLEATSAIRQLPDEEKANTVIIAMTASVLKEETDHYLKQGMNGFVPKPFKVEQLLGEIERVLEEQA